MRRNRICFEIRNQVWFQTDLSLKECEALDMARDCFELVDNIIYNGLRNPTKREIVSKVSK